MFTSRKNFELMKSKMEISNLMLRYELRLYKEELLKTVKELDGLKSKCNHKFGKWKQTKIEDNYQELTGYKETQVHKCKKCGFMECNKIQSNKIG